MIPLERAVFAIGTNVRIESELEVKAYIQNLRLALNSGARIDFQGRRRVDDERDEKFTNQYTVNTLFPNENPVDALRRELLALSVEDYMQTVRVELLGMYGQTTTFVMSFHFAEQAFVPDMFPYKKK